MRRPRLILGALLAAISLLPASSCGSKPEQPRLVVLVSIDQMRYDFLTRFGDLYEGGFKTLLERSAVYTNAQFGHGVTVTAAGHATPSTGLHPARSGMVGNSWYDPAVGKDLNCVGDPDAKPVAGLGGGASPRNLLVDTLGDRIKQTWPESQVVGISPKDRAAILFSGHEADGAFWYSSSCGCFVSSDYYFDEPPQWLVDFREAAPYARFAGQTWNRLIDDPALYERLARRDDFPAEGKDGKNVFPYQMPSDLKELAGEIGGTPFQDELTLEAAIAILDAYELGQGDTPALLGVSFSGTDSVGHRYGPFSQEAMDQHLRLDRFLDSFLQALDERVGLDNVLLALTSDHGAIPLPEFLQEQGVDAKRLPPEELEELADAAVKERFPRIAKAVAKTSSSNLYLDLQAIERAGASREDVEAAAREALLAHEDVEQVFTHADLSGEPRPDDPFWTLYRNSFHAERSPHLPVRLRKYVHPSAAPGTGHGSPYEYDRHVPLILMGRAIKPGSYSQDAGPVDIAPTLARILGVDMGEVDGRVLTEALR